MRLSLNERITLSLAALTTAHLPAARDMMFRGGEFSSGNMFGLRYFSVPAAEENLSEPRQNKLCWVALIKIFTSNYLRLNAGFVFLDQELSPAQVIV